MALGSNVNRYSLVINKDDFDNHIEITKDMISSWLQRNIGVINFFAFILHDKDQKIVDGKIIDETPHYHLVIEFIGCRSDNKVLNDMALDFKCNKRLISIKPSIQDWIKRVRYLVHIDDKDKNQYDMKDITTNNLFLFDEYFGGIDKQNLTLEVIHNLCVRSESLYDVYNFVGLKNCKSYRFIIQDMWDYTSLERFNYHKEMEKELPFN